MKNLVILVLMFVTAGSTLTASANEKIERNVQYNCLNKVRYELIKKFARENKNETSAVDEFRNYIRQDPSYACREIKNPNVEHFAWCDGSGCSFASAQLTNSKCIISEIGEGQDDGDDPDPSEDNGLCLRD